MEAEPETILAACRRTHTHRGIRTMVLTINRIKYLLEQDRIGRARRGGHDRLTDGERKALDEMHKIALDHKTNPRPAPFHLKHPKKA